jgi:hypothetical protein
VEFTGTRNKILHGHSDLKDNCFEIKRKKTRAGICPVVERAELVKFKNCNKTVFEPGTYMPVQ